VEVASRRGSGPGPSTGPGRTAVRVDIGRMTLEGRPRGDAARVSRAMAAALARLAGGLDWSAAAAVGRLDGGAVPADATPEAIGRQLASRLLRRLAVRGHTRGGDDA